LFGSLPVGLFGCAFGGGVFVRSLAGFEGRTDAGWSFRSLPVGLFGCVFSGDVFGRSLAGFEGRTDAG